MNIKCPKCKKEMNWIRKEPTQNPGTNKRYSRDVYQCKKEDIWVTVEIPE